MRAANARLRRGSGSDSRPAPKPGKRSEAAAERGQLMRIDEAVVHDLSHELGNYFHKLYYWTDCIRTGADDLGPDASPTQALDETMHRLQEFLNLALEYFQPAQLNAVRMKVRDVAGALESMLRGENPEATIESSCAADVAEDGLMVDTQRLSTGFRIVARLLGGGGGAGTTLTARIEPATSGRERVASIALSTSGGCPEAAARRAQRVVEWAVAARMIELHGGHLATDEERPGAARCVLTLPLTI